MMLGARTGAWAKSGGGVPTAKDYVQDGLVAMWDGIENAGFGKHDANAFPIDLCGNAILNHSLTSSSLLVGDDYFAVDENKKITYDAPILKSLITNDKSTWTGESCSYYSGKNPGFDSYVMILGDFDYQNKGFSSHYFGFQLYAQALSNRENGIIRSSFDYYNHYNTWISISFAFEQGKPISNAANGTFYGYKDTGYNNTYYGDYVFIGRETNHVGKYRNIRIYSRALTADEIAHNYAIDKARFNLP